MQTNSSRLTIKDAYTSDANMCITTALDMTHFHLIQIPRSCAHQEALMELRLLY